jgi:hypothetical protein
MRKYATADRKNDKQISAFFYTLLVNLATIKQNIVKPTIGGI